MQAARAVNSPCWLPTRHEPSFEQSEIAARCEHSAGKFVARRSAGARLHHQESRSKLLKNRCSWEKSVDSTCASQQLVDLLLLGAAEILNRDFHSRETKGTLSILLWIIEVSFVLEVMFS